MLKKNLRQFAGFDFEVGSSEFKKRIESTQKVELSKLKVLCEGLQLDKKGPKDAICQRICEFLVAPHKIDAPTDDEDEEEDEEEVEEGNVAGFFSFLFLEMNFLHNQCSIDRRGR